jgi:hypothetical protein
MGIQRYCAYDRLLCLALSLTELHTNINTHNPFEDGFALPEHLASKKMVQLYNLLIHGITCLHYVQREQTLEGKYISEPEDNTAALSLMAQLLPLPNFALTEAQLLFYKYLYEQYGTTKGFTVRQVIKLRYYKNVAIIRVYIQKLKKMGLLEVTGNKYRGYTYRFPT